MERLRRLLGTSNSAADEAVLEEAAVEEARHDLVDAAVEAAVGTTERLVVESYGTIVVILEETVEARGSRTPGAIGAPAHAA
ncbi:MAG: hypothetical protein ACRDGR_10565 [bacterium]